MLEFQSNASLFRNYYHHLPPSLATQHESFSLCFVVDGDPTRTSEVTVSPSYTIDQLKEAIREKLSENVPPIKMMLWKLVTPIPITLDTSRDRRVFANKVNNIQLDPDSDDPPGIVQLRYATRRVSSYWENHPLPECLHLIVRLPSPERQTKRPRLSGGGEVPRDMQELWDYTWNRQEEAIPWFILRETERDNTSTVDVPPYCWVLSPPEDIAEALDLNPPTVLFRDDYLRVFSDLFARSGLGTLAPNLDCNPGARFPDFFFGVHVPKKTPENGFILTGHPGTGKSIWLRILLILRLSARLPTFYATKATSIFFFSETGPLEIPLNSLELRFYLRRNPTAWALFDSTKSLIDPPQDFVESRHIFIVQTPSPRSERLEWRTKAPPITVSCLGLWSPAELICAAPFQNRRHNEQALVEFCELYGFSARDTYGNASDIDRFEGSLKASCDRLTYDSAVKLVSQVQDLDFPEDVSHTILCISPTKVGLRYTFDFTSAHVYRCVLESLRKSQVHAASKFYRWFLKMGKTRSVAGYMLEPAAQEILGDGGTFEISPLKRSSALKLVHWKTPEVLSEQNTCLHITSGGISVDGDGRVAGGQPPMIELPKEGALKDFAFYCPSSRTQATYDLLLYDPEDNHAWVFQVTTSPAHSVKAKGINDLRNRGVEKISFFAVTPPDTTINLPVSEEVDKCITHTYQLQLR